MKPLTKLFSSKDLLISGFGFTVLISIVLSLLLESWLVLSIPVVFIIFYLAIVDFEKLFYFLLVLIPLSIDIEFSNSLALEVPTEPLMVGLMIVYLLYALKNWEKANLFFFQHPLTALIFLHFGWILISTISTGLSVISIKFILSKTWYIIVFYFLAGKLLTHKKQFDRLAWFTLIPTIILIIWVNVRHFLAGFTFDSANSVINPFFGNHVLYSSFLCVVLPFGAYLFFQAKNKNRKIFIGFSVLFIVVSIFLSFTRASIMIVPIMAISYYLIKYKLLIPGIFISLIAGVFLINTLIHENKFLEYAPNYETTIAHKNFNSLVGATAKGEDVSTMERVYRWIAGGYMVKENPYFGVGPGMFYESYQSYTISAFQTYVSDNPERSGVHCYFLNVLVEQGWIGFIIYMILSIFAMIYGQQVYHNATDLKLKAFAMTILIIFVGIQVHMIINDLIETPKIGPYFFMILALFINIDLLSRRNNTLAN